MIGIKHDDGKPLAFTVLSKFWPVLWHQIEGHMLADEFDAFMRGGINVPLDDPDYWSDIVAVGTFGVGKYGADNWQCVDVQRYREAGARHMLAMLSEGTDALDDDSQLPHRAHFRWNALAVATLGARTVTVKHPPRRIDPVDLEETPEERLAMIEELKRSLCATEPTEREAVNDVSVECPDRSMAPVPERATIQPFFPATPEPVHRELKQATHTIRNGLGCVARLRGQR